MTTHTFTQDEKQDVMERGNAAGVTIDGKPARITGYRLDYAHIVAAGGVDVEFAWATVARIVANGGRFQS